MFMFLLIIFGILEIFSIFSILIIILLVRPTGLLGKKRREKV